MNKSTQGVIQAAAMLDEFPPRATDKQVKAAQTKAALKIGKPKHVPDPDAVIKPKKTKPTAAQIAATNVESGIQLTPRQESDAKIEADRLTAEALARHLGPAVIEHLAKELDIPVEDVSKHVKIAPALPTADVVAHTEFGAVVIGRVASALPTAPYQGPMLTLRKRLAAGVYKKAANGQPSCGDEVATILGSLEPVEVIAACLIALDISNPYLHLNVGQQSMNLRNKLRGALKHGKFGMGVLREAVEEVVEGRAVPRETPAAE